ncbi:MAG: sulfatase [Planctomycetota bacterium]|jgi:arylsulfatase A-like enzyme|nr:sulfatase [Planctomycetota bacterium]MDP7249883.1 sulfatase [Planctomycetota bacterium]
MNIIVIVLDSFRQDHVGCYHHGQPAFERVEACKTPHIDKFSESCVIFENAYPEALPTIPIRMQLMTGQRTLPYRGWEPLTKTDRTVAQLLKPDGYINGLISDTYHYRAPGMNYHRDFASYRWVRGQEYDPYSSAPTRRNIDDYVNEHFNVQWRNRVSQFLSNTDDFQSPDDWFPAQVADLSVEWLRSNRAHEKTFLWIDSFDPHEPWDPPEGFDTYTDSAYTGPRLIMPMGGMYSEWATEDEARHVQGLYAGEATFVDHCLGRLFGALEEMGCFEDSMIWLMADHGHPLGDHGKFLKGTDRQYNELLKIPFMVRMPNGEGARRSDAIVQFHDWLPTVLELLGRGNDASSMHGDSFAAVIRGETDEHRESMITGFHAGPDRCIRDKTWSYIQRPGDEPDELYNLVDDPRERENLIDEHHEVAQRLASDFGDYFRKIRSPVIKGIQGMYEMSSGTVS